MKSRIITSLTLLVLLAMPSMAQTDPAPLSTVLLPVVGDVVGVFGVHFRTDVTVINMRNIDQRVRIEWYPQDTNSTAERTIEGTIPAFTIEPIADFVPMVLETDGMGALRIVGIDASGDVDSGAELDAFARIWSSNAGGMGTVSQSLYGIHEDEVVEPTAAVNNVLLIGMKQNENYRTNVGIVNLGVDSQFFRVQVSGTNGDTTLDVEVPAGALRQVALPEGNWGDVAITIAATVGASERWTAYASTINNHSGDAWISQDAHRRFRVAQ
ncbi:MAG TPA: hypothetical protein VMS56_11425 [Thermoanaerobaculia bacterium]|nr:hypothetical protein [Thermoanaerobaculia bacterium]